MLKIENVHKTFNPGTINENYVLKGLELHLNPGDFVTVIGGNGAGKSTMLNSVAGVFPVDKGKIIINGKDVTKLPEYKRASIIGRVFQDPMVGTAANMSIQDNMALALRRGEKRTLRWGVTNKECDKYKELLKILDLGLENRLTDKVGLLSGGQRQAMSLLMSVMTPIDILILDEHTAALDPKTAEIIMEITNKVVREKKLTTLMVTHNLLHAVNYGDRIVLMHEGNCVMDKAGKDKENTQIDEILNMFNTISLERGNKV